MILLSDSPTLNEWIAIIQQDVDQAQQLLLSLRAQIKQQNLMAAPTLTISVETTSERNSSSLQPCTIHNRLKKSATGRHLGVQLWRPCQIVRSGDNSLRPMHPLHRHSTTNYSSNRHKWV
jgi:hypothetical protein